MGIGDLKRDVREKIISTQYYMPQEDIWELLNMYDKCLEGGGTSDELAEAAFLRGDVAFHMGRYHDAVAALTKSLSLEKSPEYRYLEADAYNLLGMLFSFVGYEDIALDNYLSAAESAKRSRSIRELAAALLNAGGLYQGLGEYRRAMTYYKRVYEAVNGEYSTPEMELILLCLIQEAQLLFKMGRYDDARRMRREIDSYYQVVAHDAIVLSRNIFEVWMEEKFGTKKRADELIEEIYQYLMRDAGYLEQIDFYMDFCGFLITCGRGADARRFLDVLTEKLGATEFLYLRMQMEELEVQYQRQYATEEKHQKACLRLLALRQEYEQTLLAFKRQNLFNIGSLQELENQRQEFEFRSKCDLATGLLNKEAFRYETEQYLAERNRDVVSAMILVDIDDFKLINDRFGHLVGDEVIVRLAALLKEAFGEDICGRFGGDEFVVLIRDIKNMEEAELRIERFREQFSKLGFGKNANVHNTVSIGVSYNHGISVSYKTMFSCADEALLKAKEYGKNKVTFFEIKRGLLKYV